MCLGGNIFGKDICYDVNVTWGFRREDQLQHSAVWIDRSVEAPDFVESGLARSNSVDVGRSMNHFGVRTGSRHLLQGAEQQYSGGSILVSLRIEYRKENADLGNSTMKNADQGNSTVKKMKITDLFSAIQHQDLLRQFQQQMRTRDKPVVVSWTL